MELRKDNNGIHSRDGNLNVSENVPTQVKITCVEGCETPVDRLRNEACKFISAHNPFEVEVVDYAQCNDDEAVREDEYRTTIFDVKKKGGDK